MDDGAEVNGDDSADAKADHDTKSSQGTGDGSDDNCCPRPAPESRASTAAAYASGKPPWRIVTATAGGIVVAAAVAALLKSSGYSPQGQRIAALAIVVVALLVGLAWHKTQWSDPITLFATTLAIAVAAVAGLTYVGAVDPDAEVGCINTNGPLEGTASGQTVTVFAEATVASEAKSLLIRGCVVRGTAWCVGSVHADALEDGVLDSRWLILPGDEGYVPYGRLVGPALPDGKREDCPGRRGVPGLDFQDARIDEGRGQVVLGARSRAAFIGFAVRREPEKWQRVGWDYEGRDDEPVVLRLTGVVNKKNPQVAAVACLGYQQPAMVDSEPILSTRVLRPTRDRLVESRPDAAQPFAGTAEEAACDAGVEKELAPYDQGRVISP